MFLTLCQLVLEPTTANNVRWKCKERGWESDQISLDPVKSSFIWFLNENVNVLSYRQEQILTLVSMWILSWEIAVCSDLPLEGAKLIYDEHPASLALPLSLFHTYVNTHTHGFFCSTSKNNSNWAFLLSAKDSNVFSQPPLFTCAI